MNKDFKIDAIVYSDSGAIGLYWPLLFKCPLIAFNIKGDIPDKYLVEFNALCSGGIIKNSDFIDGIQKFTIDEDCTCVEYLQEIANIYAQIGYTPNNRIDELINFKNIPDIVSSDFLVLLLYSYLGKLNESEFKEEHEPMAFDLAFVLASRKVAVGYYYLAIFYYGGCGTEPSKEKFIENLDKACELGDESAKNIKENIDFYLEQLDEVQDV